jgi:preprotein translocase subunit SecA
MPRPASQPAAAGIGARRLAAGGNGARRRRSLPDSGGHPPHRQQLLAARVLLDERLAEMATGEGKTAAIAIAAAVAALAGTPVHVVTANDYLAQRDAERAAAVLRAAWACASASSRSRCRRTPRRLRRDVTYCTGKELAFDYLRDGLGSAADLSPLEQRARALAGDGGAADRCCAACAWPSSTRPTPC